MDKLDCDPDSPEEPTRRAGVSLLRDVLIGGSVGVLLALVGVLLALGGDGVGGLKGCLVVLVLFVIVFCGVAIGHVVGGTTGAVCGGWAATSSPSSPTASASSGGEAGFAQEKGQNAAEGG